MSADPISSPLRIFVVLPHVEALGSTLSTALGPLTVAARRAGPQTADLFYSTSKGTALVALSFAPGVLTLAIIDALSAAAGRGGAAVVDPARLPDRARERFHGEYLPLFDVRQHALPSLDAALHTLAQHLAQLMPASEPRIEVRFRRGDTWQLARVRGVTSDSIALATSTPPRRGDTVDLEIVSPSLTIATRSTVVSVAYGATAVALGATGFNARFMFSGEDGRRRLRELVSSIGGDRLRVLEPPPRRRAARYPVHWPVHIGSPRGRLARAALDVSRHGMFVGCEVTSLPDDGRLHVIVPVDDRQMPVLATARVARAIPDDVARARGIERGVGIEITAISRRDDQRFGAFVARVGKRSEREILVGASPGRAADLTAALSAVGYSVTTASDATTFVDRAAQTTRPPDLAVLDSSLAGPRVVQSARQQLSLRLVPLVQIDGDSADITREAVDVSLLAT